MSDGMRDMPYGYSARTPSLDLIVCGRDGTRIDVQSMARLEDRVAWLEHQLEAERASRRQAEAIAYEHGLGDRAEVARQNRVLAATIAALTDRSHALRVPA